jgi:hypothetical protein
MASHEPYDEAVRVVAHQAARAASLRTANGVHADRSEGAISETEALLERIGRPHPEAPAWPQANPNPKPLELRTWDKILAEATETTSDELSAEALLPSPEIADVIFRHDALNREFEELHRLDAVDWMTSGIAGVLGSLVDVFLVKCPSHPSFLGGPAHSGGLLSRASNKAFANVLPEEKIRHLENAFRVPFDPSTSKALDEVVAGLGPGTHRFQSLGHDPVLAWVVGVRDLLAGEFTAIGRDGALIIQPTADPLLAGEHLITRVYHALRIVAGHLASDAATARGLPAPLMPMLLFVQKGAIGANQYTIGEVARQMYRMGYDFRHFVASSISVMVIEAIVRIAFFVRSLAEGASRREAVPAASHPRLRSQLFTAHLIATAANAGKVAITKNPLSLNWAQWQMFLRYLVPQAYWLFVGREKSRHEYIENHLVRGWTEIDEEFSESWGSMFLEQGRAVL